MTTYTYPGTNIRLIRGGAPEKVVPAADLASGDDAISADDQAALVAEQTEEPVVLPAKPSEPQAQAPPQPPQQAPPQQTQPEKHPPTHVPRDRFNEVNEERKQLRARVAELSEKWARLEERAKLAQEAQERISKAAEAPATPPRPDPEVDPYGAQLWDRDRKIEELERRYQSIEQNTTKTAEQVQQQAQAREFETWFKNNEDAYRRSNPDYDQASLYARQKLEEYWRAIGMPEQAVQQTVSQLAYSVADTARRLNQNPAEAYHKLAQMMGYAPQQAAVVTPQPAPAPSQAQQTLAQVQKGQQFQGLSNVPAANVENENWTTMTAAELADMPDDVFVQKMNDPRERQKIEQLYARLEGVL